MQIPPQIQKELMDAFGALALGFSMSVLYDLLRVLRHFFPRGLALVSVEDTLYWLIFGYLFWDMISCNLDGRLRMYIVLATFTGVVGYQRIKKALKKNKNLDKINVKERFRRKGE